ncbi:hypothetical protein M422DRAFT_778268 [Sphaerobolus stellatus SS14]|uniref:Uncharacterized protein n=1 Tax=Sphaerobolus stellatus (strain SS14) TaxID=990650 RepID=A0A0C9UVN7_SPHS4|nr:hypothetical protein M422DRAFT_778268 [Sphaerobolus stellatus SS14]
MPKKKQQSTVAPPPSRTTRSLKNKKRVRKTSADKAAEEKEHQEKQVEATRGALKTLETSSRFETLQPPRDPAPQPLKGILKNAHVRFTRSAAAGSQDENMVQEDDGQLVPEGGSTDDIQAPAITPSVSPRKIVRDSAYSSSSLLPVPRPTWKAASNRTDDIIYDFGSQWSMPGRAGDISRTNEKDYEVMMGCGMETIKDADEVRKKRVGQAQYIPLKWEPDMGLCGILAWSRISEIEIADMNDHKQALTAILAAPNHIGHVGDHIGGALLSPSTKTPRLGDTQSDHSYGYPFDEEGGGSFDADQTPPSPSHYDDVVEIEEDCNPALLAGGSQGENGMELGPWPTNYDNVNIDERLAPLPPVGGMSMEQWLQHCFDLILKLSAAGQDTTTAVCIAQVRAMDRLCAGMGKRGWSIARGMTK